MYGHRSGRNRTGVILGAQFVVVMGVTGSIVYNAQIAGAQHSVFHAFAVVYGTLAGGIYIIALHGVGGEQYRIACHNAGVGGGRNRLDVRDLPIALLVVYLIVVVAVYIDRALVNDQIARCRAAAGQNPARIFRGIGQPHGNVIGGGIDCTDVLPAGAGQLRGGVVGLVAAYRGGNGQSQQG